MADLNRLMAAIQGEGSGIEQKLKAFLIKYEELYREGNRQLLTERTASSGNMEGLEQFHRLVQILRRNKDVAGSLVRGISNLRSMSAFKFIEEDVPKPEPKKPKKAKRSQTKKQEPEPKPQHE